MSFGTQQHKYVFLGSGLDIAASNLELQRALPHSTHSVHTTPGLVWWFPTGVSGQPGLQFALLRPGESQVVLLHFFQFHLLL